MKIITPFNYKPVDGRYNTKPSETIPDDTLSIKQLLINHTRGVVSNVHQFDPVYDEDNPIPDFKSMDMAEIDEYKRNLVENAKSTKERLDEIRAEQKRRKELATIPKDTGGNLPKDDDTQNPT